MGLIPKDTPFFAMELLDGSRPILPAMASAPRVLKINLLLQLLQALSYLHHRRTLHGDIKPSNVLVVDTPQGAVARLPDFSLSSSEGDLSIERLAGTPAYWRKSALQALRIAAQRCARRRRPCCARPSRRKKRHGVSPFPRCAAHRGLACPPG
jgi:serine/threonine protein kinase